MPEKKTFILTSPDGEEFTTDNLSQFCKERGLWPSNLKKVAQGKTKSAQGWVCRYAEGKPSIDDVESSGMIRVEIHGSGFELVVGKLSEDEFEKLEDNEDSLDEDLLEEILRPWAEIDDIWHYWGPDGDAVQLQTSDGANIEAGATADLADFEDVLSVHPAPDEGNWMDDAVNIFVGLSGEKGYFGYFEIPEDYDSSKLAIITGAPEFADEEYVVVYGFIYDGKPLDVIDDESSTRGTSRQFTVFNVEDWEEKFVF